MTGQQIFDEINQWIITNFPNDQRGNWYVGITHDIQARLFGDHAVHPKNHDWIYQQAINSAHARSAEATFLKLGHDGGSGGGNHTATFVYAFRKDQGTVR